MRARRGFVISSSFIFLLLNFFLTSCEKVEEGEVDYYTISQNNHYSNGHNFEKGEALSLQNCSKRVDFEFEINSSMFYNPTAPGFQNGHNKIRGISCISGLNITQYSARITWRCNKSLEMDIGYIIHLPHLNESHIQGFLLRNVHEGDLLYCIIEDRGKNGFYFFVQNETSGQSHEEIVDKDGAGDVKSHKLIEAPYFGGKETAPHDIYIGILTVRL